MGAPVVHFEIGGKDGKKLRAFYGKLFDWKTTETPGMDYGMVDNGGKGINGGLYQAMDNTPPMATFYVAVKDPQATLDQAVALGGRVIVPVTVIPNMVTFAQLADPDGNVIGIVKDEMPAK
jgi:predicted enzyme related to lactoylglutathione lyase